MDAYNIISIQDAQTLVASFDHESITVDSNSKSHTIKVKVKGNRKIFLENVRDKLEKSNFISELITKSYFSKSSGHIKVGNIYIITKPTSGASEDLSIHTANLTRYGEQVNLDILGTQNVSCSRFQDAPQLIGSVMREFEENPKVSPQIIKVYDDYFKHIRNTPSEFTWNSKVKQSEKNELGKYLGEVILGIVVASDGISAICDDYPFIQAVVDPKHLIYPVSSNFKNIDSIIEASKFIPISNKLGIGASASFFSNILPYIENTEAPVLKKLVNYKNQALILPKVEQQFSLIYDYGINDCLQLKINDPIQIYRDLKLGNFTKEVFMVVAGVQKYTSGDTCKSTKKMLEYLSESNKYSCITGFFCRELAKDLNADVESMTLMELIISTKDFYQANLNYYDWLNGKIRYSINKTENLKLVMQGNKSGYSDLSCSAGKINYELRKYYYD